MTGPIGPLGQVRSPNGSSNVVRTQGVGGWQADSTVGDPANAPTVGKNMLRRESGSQEIARQLGVGEAQLGGATVHNEAGGRRRVDIPMTRDVPEATRQRLEDQFNQRYQQLIQGLHTRTPDNSPALDQWLNTRFRFVPPTPTS